MFHEWPIWFLSRLRKYSVEISSQENRWSATSSATDKDSCGKFNKSLQRLITCNFGIYLKADVASRLGLGKGAEGEEGIVLAAKRVRMCSTCRSSLCAESVPLGRPWRKPPKRPPTIFQPARRRPHVAPGECWPRDNKPRRCSIRLLWRPTLGSGTPRKSPSLASPEPETAAISGSCEMLVTNPCPFVEIAVWSYCSKFASSLRHGNAEERQISHYSFSFQCFRLLINVSRISQTATRFYVME